MLYPVELRAQRPFSPSESGVVRGGESVVFPSRRPIPFLKGAALLVVASEPHRFLAPLRGEEERRGWDSNPGAALWAAARFPAVLLRPLGHLSIVVVSSIPNNHPSGRRTERVGFEPTRVLRPYRFSGPAESTSSRTSPSLRIAELAVCPMLFQMFGAVRSLSGRATRAMTLHSKSGGEGGIRTHETLHQGLIAFKAIPVSHLGTSPVVANQRNKRCTTMP